MSLLSPSPRTALWSGIFLVLAGCAAFAFYTNLIWEDFLITLRPARNFLDGNGLVFQPGERVFSFTSPLNIVGCILSTMWFSYDNIQATIWVYRLLSAAFLCGTLYWMWRLWCETAKVPMAGFILLSLLLALETKTIAYAMNGQEPAFTVFFLALGLYAAQGGLAARWKLAGIAWGGLFWSRPEAMFYAGGLALGSLMFCEKGGRRSEFQGALKAAALGAAIYLPWLVGTWIYYGNPVPHTILAKAGLNSARSAQLSTAEYIAKYFPINLAHVYAPIYLKRGWPDWTKYFSLLATLPALLCLFLPLRDKVCRIASVTLWSCCVFYMIVNTRGVVFAWYYPPAAFLGLVALARLPWALKERWPKFSAPLQGLATLAAIGTLAGAMGVFSMTMIYWKIAQDELEFGNRKKIGLWLREHVQPGERVYLECLGYIGYFSRAKMLDFPGLATPEVAKINRANKSGFYGTMVMMKPEWLVLRDLEVKSLLANPATRNFLNDYTAEAVFDVTEKAKDYPWIPSTQMYLVDARFAIFHRKPAQ